MTHFYYMFQKYTSLLCLCLHQKIQTFIYRVVTTYPTGLRLVHTATMMLRPTRPLLAQATKYLFPAMSPTMESGTLMTWYKKEGTFSSYSPPAHC